MRNLLTVEQLAIKLQLSKKTIYGRISANDIKSVKKEGRRGLFDIADFTENYKKEIEVYYIYQSKINNE